MSANTAIEWADHTFNPWTGCQPVSLGCDGCYAASWAKRAGRDFSVRKRTKTWGDPVKWNDQHQEFFAVHGRRQRRHLGHRGQRCAIGARRQARQQLRDDGVGLRPRHRADQA